MTAAELLKEIEADGVTVALVNEDEIKATCKADAIKRWAPALKEHKAAIIEILEAREGYYREWFVYFDQSVKHLIYHPPVTRAYVEGEYPGAVRVESVIRQFGRQATEAEQVELRSLIKDMLTDIDVALECCRMLNSNCGKILM